MHMVFHIELSFHLECSLSFSSLVRAKFVFADGRLTTGAEPPCGFRSVTELDLKCCKGKTSPKRILDSKVGSSDLLGGMLQLTRTPPKLDAVKGKL